MPSTEMMEVQKGNGAKTNGHAGTPRANGAKSHVKDEATQVSQEIMRLVDASKEGRLTERGRPEQFTGMYREMVEGINEMLDAILLPIGEGNRILAQISAGKIDELIAQTYKGDHEKMKVAVNNVAVVPSRLQKELARLIEASKEGQLSGSRQAGAVPGRVRGDCARREHHAGCDSAADRGGQPHSGPGCVGQDRRADRPDLQGRSRKDEAGDQQRGCRSAGPAEGDWRG